MSTAVSPEKLQIITISADAPDRRSDDQLQLEFEFDCEAGTYDLYVHQTVRGPGIFSRASVQINELPPARFIRYPYPPPPYWMQVDRVTLSAGRHELTFRHLPGMGFNERFQIDQIQVRPTATSATHWRWGVTQLSEQSTIQEREARLSLTSVQEVQTYQRRVRESFIHMLGSIPTQRTDLQAQITGTLQRRGYRIEKVIFQSRPSFYVPALLYVPDGLDEKRPGVLHLPGHSPNGKAKEAYQELCSGLALKGYVVLSIDPVNQGERGPYYAPGNSHEGQGMQGFLAHDLNPGYFIWDGVRALDYLQSRPEVVPDRLGVTGISGGGVMTMLMAFFDERVTGAVGMGGPVTTEAVLWSSYDPDGTFQDVMKPYGGTNEAIVSCIAPRGFVIQNGDHDPGFPASAGLELFEQAQHFYKVLGAPEMLACEYPDAGHEINVPMRRNVYKWMNRFLSQSDWDDTDPGGEFLPDEQLYCTPTGLVETSFADAESVWSIRLTKAKQQRVAVAMRRPGADCNPEQLRRYQSEILSRARKILNYQPRATDLDAVTVKTGQESAKSVERICFKSEDPMHITGELYLSADQGDSRPAVIYLNQSSTNAPAAWLDQMIDRGWAVFCIHARLTPPAGVSRGERVTSAAHCGYHPLAMKTVDLLGAADCLRARKQIDATSLYYFGDGDYAGLVALFAGVIDEQAAGVVADTSLMSLFDLLQQQTPNGYEVTLQEPMFLPGAMAELDVVDLAAALAPRRLMLLAPDAHHIGPNYWGGAERPEFQWPEWVYQQLDGSTSLKRASHDDADRLEQIADWLNTAL